MLAVCTAAVKAWPIIVSHQCHERSVERLAAAREKGVAFDLPAAIEQLQPRARVIDGQGDPRY
jgi:hypothetical protein